MVQEVHMNPAGAVVKHVAEIARPAGKDAERIGTEQGEATDRESGAEGRGDGG